LMVDGQVPRKIRGWGVYTYPEKSVNLSSMLIGNEFLRQIIRHRDMKLQCLLLSMDSS
jgi:hypothetical protein